MKNGVKNGLTKKEQRIRRDYLNSHSKPITRREFVSRGLMGASGCLLAPTLGSLLYAESAQAKAAGASTAAFPKFLVFDLAGGAALVGNFLVGAAGGPEDLLPSYSTLGWNPRRTALDRRFGLPMAGDGVSRMLTGLTQVMSPAAQANFRMGSFLHNADIDISINPLSAISMITRAGLGGGLIKVPVGDRSRSSGGNSRAAEQDPAFAAFYVQSLESFQGAAALAEPFQSYPEGSPIKLVQSMAKLSSLQAKAMLSSNRKGFEGVKSAYEGLVDRLSNFENVDPRVDADFRQLYNIQQNTNSSSTPVVRAAIVHSVLRGISGGGVVTIGGCDYHDGTQETGDDVDLQIGLEIGRAVELAHRSRTPLFIQIITDGGIYSRGDSRIWEGDSPVKCMTVVGYYDPSGPREFYKGRQQVGAFTPGQGADSSYLISRNPAMAAYATLANYLHVMYPGTRIRERFNRVANIDLTDNELEELLVFS